MRLLGLPYEGRDNFIPGVSLAPERIRWARESIEDYSVYWWLPAPALDDQGDLDPAQLSGKDMVEHFLGEMSEKLPNGEPCLFLGGDHLVTLPAVRHYQNLGKRFEVLHLDAHLDRRQAYEGSRYSYATVIARVEEAMGAERVHTLGFRSKAPEETRSGVPFAVLEPLKRLLETNDGPFYLTLDLDVLDPSVFPAVTNPEPLGVSVRELLDAFRLLRGRLIAADIVEYNPLSDDGLRSAVTAAFLLRELSFCFEVP